MFTLRWTFEANFQSSPSWLILRAASIVRPIRQNKGIVNEIFAWCLRAFQRANQRLQIAQMWETCLLSLRPSSATWSYHHEVLSWYSDENGAREGSLWRKIKMWLHVIKFLSRSQSDATRLSASRRQRDKVKIKNINKFKELHNFQKKRK